MHGLRGPIKGGGQEIESFDSALFGSICRGRVIEWITMPLQPPQDLGVWRRAGRVAAVTFLITTALTAADATATFRQYCYQCHGSGAQMAGLSLERLAAQGALGDNFRPWEKVATALSEKKMPPKGMPQPSDEQRAQAVSWIKTELAAYAKAHAGDPGKVTVRRLTSGEYAYAIEDLTGLPLDTGIDASRDSVGGGPYLVEQSYSLAAA